MTVRICCAQQKVCAWLIFNSQPSTPGLPASCYMWHWQSRRSEPLPPNPIPSRPPPLEVQIWQLPSEKKGTNFVDFMPCSDNFIKFCPKLVIKNLQCFREVFQWIFTYGSFYPAVTFFLKVSTKLNLHMFQVFVNKIKVKVEMLFVTYAVLTHSLKLNICVMFIFS